MTATDYSDSRNWLRMPDEIRYGIDVLYLYPTCFMPSYEGEVCTIDNMSMREQAEAAYNHQGAAFEAMCNMFAPLYRQVDAMSLIGLDEDGVVEAESGDTKSDVFAALDHYFGCMNDGRPYILAGHSQGSMVLRMVLSEYMVEHPEVYSRMVATYMLGMAATRTWLAANPHVRMAECAGDTGVVVSWNTEGPLNKGVSSLIVPGPSVCINPLNWRTDGVPAGVEENLGCLEDVDGGVVVVEGYADATVDTERGTVVVSSVEPERFAIPMVDLFGPQSYHAKDYDFFFMNIRENAALRIRNFLEGRGGCD